MKNLTSHLTPPAARSFLLYTVIILLFRNGVVAATGVKVRAVYRSSKIKEITSYFIPPAEYFGLPLVGSLLLPLVMLLLPLLLLLLLL